MVIKVLQLSVVGKERGHLSNIAKNRLLCHSGKALVTGQFEWTRLDGLETTSRVQLTRGHGLLRTTVSLFRLKLLRIDSIQLSLKIPQLADTSVAQIFADRQVGEKFSLHFNWRHIIHVVCLFKLDLTRFFLCFASLRCFCSMALYTAGTAELIFGQE